jgi:glucosyl-3-phosphoglycerate synthase
VFTFAVVGHNERELLAIALEQALAAARDGDEVVFVDSASTDGSAATARAGGVRVLEAPIGKGRAVAAALADARTEYLVVVDADIESSATNIPAELRTVAVQTGADMVVGEFTWPERPLMNTLYVYGRLVPALFPDAVDAVGDVPFCGFRALRADFPWGDIPPGFGAETHLNLTAVTAGASLAVAQLGGYHGPVRPKPLLGLEVGEAIFDAAVAGGRLAPAARPAWEEWLGRVVAEIAAPPRAEREARIAAAAARPLPAPG